MDDALLVGQSALIEAKGLRPLLRDGYSVEDVMELIEVPRETEQALRAYAKAEPSDARWVEAILKFRRRVALEFQRLVREGIPTGEEQCG
jgi:hypothetical protein